MNRAADGPAAGAAAPGETRALWVVRHSIATPAAADRLVALAAKYGYRDLIVQVRARGDALFSSGLEPQSEVLRDADYDPLAYVLVRSQAAGLRVHAWLNALFTWSGPKLPISPDHMLNAHSDWVMVHESGRPMAYTDHEGLYVCPAKPEVQAHLWRVYTDLVQRYPVEGIHLDYIRYPGQDFCYCPTCQLAFTRSLIGKGDQSQAEDMVKGALARWGTAWPNEPEYAAAWSAFRRRQVTELVAAICRGVKRVRPTIQVSAAVIANLGDAYRSRLQDWREWMRQGIVDVLCPMAYSKETGTVEDQVREAVAEAHGIPVWAGIGAWQVAPDSAYEKIRAARHAGAAGFALFSYGGITGEVGDDAYLIALQARLTGSVAV